MTGLEKDTNQTLRRSNRIAGLPPIQTLESNQVLITESQPSPSTSESSGKIEEEVVVMEQTLKELASPVLDQQPLCIELDASFELKSGLIHLLPKFSGLSGVDLNQHLKEFHVVVMGMKQSSVNEDKAKLKAFPFSLEGSAKEWLYYLSPGSVTTWEEMKKLFLERYFPSSKATLIRKQICGIQQYGGETLYEYWERFKKLCASCPHHQISEQLLLQYLYEGLVPTERSMIDAASGGALVNKTAAQARALIENMAANSQQFTNRAEPPKRVNEVSTPSNIEQQIANLTSLFQQFATGTIQQAKVCGVCSTVGHHTDMCPNLQDGCEQANALGGYQGQQ